MNNVERRDNGKAYLVDEMVASEIIACRKLIQKLNTSDWTDFEQISHIIKELLGSSEGAFINPPFFCDYGKNIKVGKNFFANYNCTIIDVAKVVFGDNCFLGPNVSIYTAGHPIYPTTRNSSYEFGKPVTIGDNVWIGGSVVICPGVNIGSNVVIGAGSVVTKDVPSWTIAAGNPCKVLRAITENDKRRLFKDELIDDEVWDIIVKEGFIK